MRTSARSDEGFTLVELLVTMVIFGVVSAVVGASLIQGLQTSRRVEARTAANQTATLALERLARHARAAAPLASVSGTALEVENVEGGICRRYRYAYNTTTRDVTEQTSPCTATSGAGITTIAATASRTLLREVRNGTATPLFTALDRTGASTTTANRVASIELRVVMDPPEAPPFEVRSAVALRNAR